MDQSVERTQQTYIKLTLGVLIGLIAFIFLCYFGYRFYSVFESRRMVRRAAAFMGGGDLRQAALSAQRALQLNPESVGAFRQLAQISEVSNDRNALVWRRKAFELDPHSVQDLAALVASALQFRDIETAEKALTRSDENAQNTVEFHIAAAQLAEAKKQWPEAQNHWEKAVNIAPENKPYQLHFAVALLRMDDRSKRDRGLALLEQLRNDEKQRAPATRALIADCLAHRPDGERLKTLGQELQGYPEALFTDRILYLDLLRQTRDPKFSAYLTNIEHEAASKAAELASVISWMKASGMSLLAIDFARTVPADVLSKWPVPLAIAESYARLADWAGLERSVKDGNWGQFDFLRHAHLALALRGRDQSTAADREWALAEKQAESQPKFLSMLWREASEWGWHKETSDLLWTMTKYPETRMEAFQSLYQSAIETGDTPGLYHALLRLIELRPDDMSLQNNLAQVSLLLKADMPRAQKLALDLYRKEQSNPAYASTYAFALYTKGDTKGALKVLSELKEDELREPSMAAYYGIFLAAAGDGSKAREFLKLAASAKLLPEEKALVAKAESSVR